MKGKDVLRRIGKFAVRLEQEEYPSSPSDWGDTGAFLVGWHSRNFWVLPPGKKRADRYNPQSALDDYKDTHHIFMLEAYIHSGVRLELNQCGNFPDRRWDVSSNIGAVFLSKSEWKTKSAKRTIKYALGLVEEWNQYLCGDVWGYVISELESADDDAEAVNDHVYSCWGFYGRKYAEEEAVGALLAHIDSERRKHLQYLKAMIRNHVPLQNREACLA